MCLPALLPAYSLNLDWHMDALLSLTPGENLQLMPSAGLAAFSELLRAVPAGLHPQLLACLTVAHPWRLSLAVRLSGVTISSYPFPC